MPTYKLGPASVRGVPPHLVVLRPLICEKCAEALGNVAAPGQLSRMSATLVAEMWPEVRPAVNEHEAVCPYRD